MSNEPQRRFFRDLFIVAGQELADSLRTKRAWLIVLLFLASSVAGTLAFIKLLNTVETELAKTLLLEAGSGTGGTTAALWKSSLFRGIVTGMVGDKNVAEALLGFTPLGLYYGWLALTFGPWLVALTSSARVTEEIWGGSIRFVLFRTSRLAWLLGKYAGQSLQLLVALLVSAAGAWTAGWLKLDGFDGGATLAHMMLFAGKAWIYGTAFLGLVTGVSIYCKSPGIANVMGVIALLAATVTYHVSKYFAADGWRRILDLTAVLTPRGHYFDLMRPDTAHALPAAVFLLALGFGFVMLGYARLSRRDL